MNRLLTIIFASVLTSPITSFINKYIFSDWEFVCFLMILVIIDTGLGLWKHWSHGTISSTGFGAFFKKMAIYGSMLILCHVATSFKINGEVNCVFSWMPHVIYSGIVLKESISFIENIGAVKPDWIPTGLLKKLKQFDKEGKFNEKTTV